MDLVRSATGAESELLGGGEEVSSAGERVLIVILMLVVDLRLGPPEDPEGVAGSEVDEGKNSGSGTGFPARRRRKKNIADEMLVGRIRGRVDSKPVELGGGFDPRPMNQNWIA